MKDIGRLLGEAAVDDNVALASVYLYRLNGTAMELLSYRKAEALLKRASESPACAVTGGLEQGFAWSVPGAHPRRLHAVTPLAAPTRSAWGGVTCGLIELWWADHVVGGHRVVSYNRLFEDPFTAYMTACCLWTRPDTGQGAVTAVLYGRDRAPFIVDRTAADCARLTRARVDGLLASRSERFTTADPPMAAGFGNSEPVNTDLRRKAIRS